MISPSGFRSITRSWDHAEDEAATSPCGAGEAIGALAPSSTALPMGCCSLLAFHKAQADCGRCTRVPTGNLQPDQRGGGALHAPGTPAVPQRRDRSRAPHLTPVTKGCCATTSTPAAAPPPAHSSFQRCATGAQGALSPSSSSVLRSGSPSSPCPGCTSETSPASPAAHVTDTQPHEHPMARVP